MYISLTHWLIIFSKGTSLISFIIPHKKSLPDIFRKLTEEHSAAANIKTNTTRKSIIESIKSTVESKNIISQHLN